MPYTKSGGDTPLINASDNSIVSGSGFIGGGGSPTANAWTPLSLPGIKIVLESWSGTTVDGSNKVTAWVDQKSSLTFSETDGASRPTSVANQLNGKAIIRYTRGQTLGNATAVIGSSSAFSWYMVLKPTTLTDWDTFLKLKNANGTTPPAWAFSNQGGYSKLYLSAPDTWALYRAASNPATVAGQWHKVIGTYNGSGAGVTGNHSLIIDGTTAALSATSADGASANTNQVGSYAAAGAYSLTGDVAVLYAGTGAAGAPVWSATDYANIDAYVLSQLAI